MTKNNIDSILKYRIKEPLNKSTDTPTIFLLHGIGSNMDDLFSLNHFFADEWRIISFQAPISLGFGGWAWAELDLNNLRRYPKPEQRITSRNAIIKSIKTLKKEFNIKSKNSYLLGFSQGATFTLLSGLTNPSEFNGLIAICGFYKAEEDIKEIDIEKIKNLEIFVSNGTADEVIPIHMGRMTNLGLKKVDLSHTYNEYDTGHTISNDCLNDILFWLQEKHQI
jgi:phospholipase/carboxylesterase